MRLLAGLVGLTMLLGLAGCGDSGPPIAPVSGTVYVNGQPKGGLHVVFQPMGSRENPNPGRGSTGKTDENGRYELRYDGTERKGAVVGKHRVAIATAEADAGDRFDPETGSPDGEMPAPKETIPAKYNDRTELTFEVPKEGTDKADFKLDVPKLKTKGRPASPAGAQDPRSGKQ